MTGVRLVLPKSSHLNKQHVLGRQVPQFIHEHTDLRIGAARAALVVEYGDIERSAVL